jgi:hypothetical protein
MFAESAILECTTRTGTTYCLATSDKLDSVVFGTGDKSQHAV